MPTEVALAIRYYRLLVKDNAPVDPEAVALANDAARAWRRARFAPKPAGT